MNANDYRRLIACGSLQNGLKLNTHRKTIKWEWVIVFGLVALLVIGHFFGG